MQYDMKAKVSGGVAENEKGWFWLVRISIEGAEDLFVSSNASGVHYSNKAEAEEELKKAGDRIVKLVAETIGPAGAVDIIDRNRLI